VGGRTQLEQLPFGRRLEDTAMELAFLMAQVGMDRE